MAAYDAGEGRILKSLQRTGARDFWGLRGARRSAAKRATTSRSPRDGPHRAIRPASASTSCRTRSFVGFRDDHEPVDLGRVAEAVGATLPTCSFSTASSRRADAARRASKTCVPRGTAGVRGPAPLPAAPEAAERRITVKKGETLSRAAARAGVSPPSCATGTTSRGREAAQGTVLAVPSRPKGHPKEHVAAARRRRPRAIGSVPTPASAITRRRRRGPVHGGPWRRRRRPRPPALPARPGGGFADEPAAAVKSAAPQGPPHGEGRRDAVLAGEPLRHETRRSCARTGSLGPAARAGQTLTLTLAVLN